MNDGNKENVVQNDVVSSNNSTINNGLSKNMYANPNNKKEFLADSDLLYNFIGHNYQRIVRVKFNIPALLLSVIYLLFRKMYFYSFVVTLLYVLLLIFVKDSTYLIVGILTINTILFLFTNKLYLRHCRTKIDNIRYKHSFFGNEEMLNECRKIGGTSIISIFIGLIMNAIIIFLLIFSYFYFIEKVSFNDIFGRIIDLFKDIPFCK